MNVVEFYDSMSRPKTQLMPHFCVFCETILRHSYMNTMSSSARTLNDKYKIAYFITTRHVARATHARNRVCPRVELILNIIIVLLIIFLGFIKSKPC